VIDLDGKVAIVTGGAAGIGAAAVKIMADLGAKVVIADIDEAKGAALAAYLGPDRTAFFRADILVEGDIRSMIDLAADRFGGLDILMNNAGIPRTIAPDAEVTELTLEMWNKTIAGHVTSAMLGCKYAIPHMKRRGGGAIVNTSSSSAPFATVDLVSYGVAKSGLHALTREVAATYGRDNIRCNAVIPGAVMTERGRKTLPRDIFQLMADETVLPRLAQPEDIANVAVFLASGASQMITGQAISADGGMMIKLPYWLPKMKARLGDRFAETTHPYEEP
jgi:NAD(P)-dependent dehydrogenase (short-subunit alcohol dehydrogenase family)